MSLTITELTERIEFDVKRNEKKDPFREVDIRARKAITGNSKLSYQDAVHAVFNEDPDLHRLYLETIPPVHHNQGGA